MLRPSSPVEAIATFSSISSLTGSLRICIFVSVDYCASLPARLFLLVPGFGLTVKSAGTAPKKHFELAPNLTPLESTLLQLFILKNLKLFRINTYEKQGVGVLSFTCRHVAISSELLS